jgi:hypothetical protein
MSDVIRARSRFREAAGVSWPRLEWGAVVVVKVDPGKRDGEHVLEVDEAVFAKRIRA